MSRRLVATLVASVALLAFGAAACVPPTPPDEVAALGGAYNTNCALYGSGAVKCWGNVAGTAFDTVTPTAVTGVRAAFRISQGEGAAGHICVVVTGGATYCWGRNDVGQLGPGTLLAESPNAVLVPNLAGASDIAAGGRHTCVVATVGGDVWCWGNNAYGELGDGTTNSTNHPVQVVGLTQAVRVVAGRTYTCALVVGGTVWCWGSGPLGHPGVPTTGSSTPVQVLDPGSLSPVPFTGVVDIAGGDGHVCVRRSEIPASGSPYGTVWCWGVNNRGQLGNGTTTSSPLPVQATAMVGATALSAGTDQTCAVSTQFTSQTDGLTCWGRAEFNGLAAATLVPLATGGASFVKSLHAGANSSCVLGQLALANPPSLVTGTGCWGWNKVYQLGSPPVPLSDTSVAPVFVQGL